MYLSKKRVMALEMALEALEFGMRNNIDSERCGEACDVIVGMLRSYHLNKRAHRHPNVPSTPK